MSEVGPLSCWRFHVGGEASNIYAFDILLI